MRRRLIAAAVLAALFVGAAGLAGLAWTMRASSASADPRHQVERRNHLITLTSEADRPRAPEGTPNLVLVIGCTVRRDQTSIHGGPPEATPFLSALAREGVRFEDMITAAPWTRAASTAILTGHHPIAVGMAEPARRRDERVLADRVVTIADHLRSQGFATAGLTTNPNLNAVYGFDQGFDRYRQPAYLWRQVRSKTPGIVAVPAALQMLEDLTAAPEATNRPFYLQVMLIDAHAPYAADPDEFGRFATPELPEEVARYRASLARLDAAVARLEAGLRERGYDETNTIFAFTNDHGDGLNWPPHHGASHGRYLAPSSVGGLFVARGPGLPRGAVVRGLASQVDIAPTLAGLLGLAPFPAPGIDLSQIATSGGASPRQAAFTETWFKDVDRAAMYAPTVACQLDLHPRGYTKGPRFANGCFDRQRDPGHANPFRDDALEARVRDWRAERIGDASAFGPIETAHPNAATRRQLEALGYTE